MQSWSSELLKGLRKIHLVGLKLEVRSQLCGPLNLRRVTVWRKGDTPEKTVLDKCAPLSVHSLLAHQQCPEASLGEDLGG